MKIKCSAEREFNRELGLAIRARRLSLGLSQKYLGKKIGVSYQQMQKYEAGHTAISLYRLQGIFRELRGITGP